jgi:hypothetical protein
VLLDTRASPYFLFLRFLAEPKGKDSIMRSWYQRNDFERMGGSLRLSVCCRRADFAVFFA